MTPATMRLADGTLGYYVRWPRKDDCFAAAIATCLQVPIEEVPDPRLDERVAAGEPVVEIDDSVWDDLYAWLDIRGLRMILHHKVPAARRRWIGVIPIPGAFMSHCLVMTRREVLFDPARIPPLSLAAISWRFRARDIRYGLSFQTAPQSKEQ